MVTFSLFNDLSTFYPCFPLPPIAYTLGPCFSFEHATYPFCGKNWDGLYPSDVFNTNKSVILPN